MIAKLSRFLLLAGALWLTGCGAPFEPESDWPDASPAIWEITASDGQKGWVFGTVHALPDDLAWGSSTLDETFEQAGVLASPQVLGHDAFILDRHQIAGEGHHPGAAGAVPAVQR